MATYVTATHSSRQFVPCPPSRPDLSQLPCVPEFLKQSSRFLIAPDTQKLTTLGIVDRTMLLDIGQNPLLLCYPHLVTVNFPPSLRPKTSGKYIS